MTKLAFRIVVLAPFIATIVGAWVISGAERADWPEPAVRYLAWYRSSAPTTFEFWTARLGLVGLVGMLVSSIGVVLLMSWARYVYVLSVAAAIVAELHTTPVLVNFPDALLDNLSKLGAGLSIALMFTSPCADWFAGSKRSRPPS
jgi:hypothetical protein